MPVIDRRYEAPYSYYSKQMLKDGVPDRPPELLYEGTMTDHTHSAAWNEVERRPKPASLLDNMTSQGKQYTRTTVAARYWQHSDRQLNRTYLYTSKILVNKSWDLSVNSGYPVPDWQTKLRLDVKNTKVSLGETLAEYRQACNMFGNFAHGAVSAWRSFKGKNRSRKRITPCSVAAANLVTTYGINPLANVLYDSLEELYFALGIPPTMRFCSMQTKRTAENVLYDDGTFDVRIQRQATSRAIAHLGFNTFGRSSAFSFGNPLQLAWELVPYSFVLDWALPIGDYLSSLDAMLGIGSVKGTVTTKERGRARATFHPNNYVAGSYTKYQKLVQLPEANWDAHKRVTINNIPMGDPPQWRPSLSWHKVKNGASLIVNILKPCKGMQR